QGRFVWVAGADGKAGLKPIEGSSWVGRDWLITKGVAVGDLVIVDNLLKLRPGASVAPKEATPVSGATPAAGAAPAASGTAPASSAAPAAAPAPGAPATSKGGEIKPAPAPGAKGS